MAVLTRLLSANILTALKEAARCFVAVRLIVTLYRKGSAGDHKCASGSLMSKACPTGPRPYATCISQSYSNCCHTAQSGCMFQEYIPAMHVSAMQGKSSPKSPSLCLSSKGRTACRALSQVQSHLCTAGHDLDLSCQRCSCLAAVHCDRDPAAVNVRYHGHSSNILIGHLHHADRHACQIAASDDIIMLIYEYNLSSFKDDSHQGEVL